MSVRLSYFMIAASTIVVAVALFYSFGYMPVRPGFTHVWGHVSYNGKPVPGCVVYFQSTDPMNSHWGIGILSDSGLYSLTAYQLDYPLEPGPYTIFIRPLTPGLIGTDVFQSKLAAADSKGSTQGSSGSSLPKPHLPVPKRFTDPKTSGLQVNIDGRPQRIEIHLTD